MSCPTVSNLAFNAGAMVLTAGAEMARRVLPAFAVLAVVTLAALFVP